MSPFDYFSHIPLKQLIAEDPRTPTAVNGGQITIHKIKQLPTTFIIPDVNCGIFGLDTITINGLQLTYDGYKSYCGNEQTEVKLHYIGKHFYLKAFDGHYNYVDYTKDFESWCYDRYDYFKLKNMVYGPHHEDTHTCSHLRRQHPWRSITTRSEKTTNSQNTKCSNTRKNRQTQHHSLTIS
eukprot:5010895-Amphidinium_carterae.1